MLADFGIGREVASISGLTVTNMTLGTVNYAAPDQLMGEAISVGARIDMRWLLRLLIFSLAIRCSATPIPRW